MSAMPVYPVRVEGQLDSHLSRWLWLVKWLLVIPHLIVLAFLWIAFFVMSIFAFFAIVFTGRYPRSIFDFNVGVLRWSWRVGFYSYSALGTDRYPPFTLGEAPGYPAVLEIDYPQHLSRGLALVKWWLLAIPHYLIVGFFLGAGWVATQRGGGGGLIFVLVVIAGVALLFTRHYPRGIFDFVLGLNRWVLRVCAYAALMTDVYPPFRLDLGAGESGTLPLFRDTEAPVERRSGNGGKIVGAVFASIACLIGVALALGGAGMIAADRTQRDSDGYIMSSSRYYSTPGYAITTRSIDVPVGGPDRLVRDFVGTVRIASNSDQRVFVGIASKANVDRYLGDVRREVVRDISHPSSAVQRGWGEPSTRPAARSFWVAQTTGSGSQTLDWKVRSGTWVAVVMNANARSAVASDLKIGGEAPNLGWIGAGVLGGGLLVLGLGGFGLWAALRRL